MKSSCSSTGHEKSTVQSAHTNHFSLSFRGHGILSIGAAVAAVIDGCVSTVFFEGARTARPALRRSRACLPGRFFFLISDSSPLANPADSFRRARAAASFLAASAAASARAAAAAASCSAAFRAARAPVCTIGLQRRSRPPFFDLLPHLQPHPCLPRHRVRASGKRCLDVCWEPFC